MNRKSILLALSGSEESRHATDVCWNLANRLGSSITAHHVVDTYSAWEFLGHENPGFLESRAYRDVYQQLVSSLFNLGEELAAEYAREAQLAQIDNVCLLDEGNPVTEICKRSNFHKVVVIGHKADRESGTRSQFQRLSVAEALAHECEIPLLIVQDKCDEWTSLSIMLSLDHINEVYINSCLDMAEALGLPANLLCLTGGAHEEKAESFVQDMRQSNPRLKDIPIALSAAHKQIAINIENWYAPANKPFNKDLWTNTLMVIPTRMVAGERLTVVDSSPSVFVRNLSVPSILLWPEEYEFSGLLSDGRLERERNLAGASV